MPTPARLTVNAEQIADLAYRSAIPRDVLMAIIRLIPERLFVRLSF